MEDDQTDPEMVLLVLMERAFKGPTHEGVRILDWAPQLKRVLKCVRENDPMTMELRGEIERLRAELAESQEKAIRFDLDQAGIEQREREAIELVTLRAKNARLIPTLKLADHYDASDRQIALVEAAIAADDALAAKEE